MGRDHSDGAAAAKSVAENPKKRPRKVSSAFRGGIKVNKKESDRRAHLQGTKVPQYTVKGNTFDCLYPPQPTLSCDLLQLLVQQLFYEPFPLYHVFKPVLSSCEESALCLEWRPGQS